ncbi:glycosyltransferase family 4 protein [Paenibacillus antri]|uniref:Glycosyltransferase family 4 protein n=1 Tax=Paenibacillus antri TaxID=2582848 RepID=A0A5R9GP53_9BACL|nr:glycosyltransferase family 4 protein [Paenibacillus antri]TLS53995.1 glycosyltransferase family 4 protein [Paenibacillus antri]
MARRSLHIAMICTERLPVPPIRGGAIQILIGGALPHLAKRHRVTVYCVADPELPDREVAGRVAFERVPKDRYVYNVAVKLEEARKAGLIYDVVHVFNRPAHVLIYKSAMPESRFVVSLHNEMFREGKISEEMGRLSVRAIDRIMSISDYIGDTIVTRFPAAAGKLRTVYSAVDLQRYAPVWTEEGQRIRTELRRQYGLEGKKVVLYVGRLSAVKGPDVLIQAMERVFRSDPEAVLLIVGSKWFSDDTLDDFGERLRRSAEAFGDRIVFTGFLPPSRVPDAFLAGDVFVCSSQWQEPLARVHYEAMAAGLPIVTTNRGGNSEIVRHGVNGLVIDDYANPDAFADAILRLFGDPEEAERMARAGRAFVERNHGFEHAARRLELLYMAAVNRKKIE